MSKKVGFSLETYYNNDVMEIMVDICQKMNDGRKVYLTLFDFPTSFCVEECQIKHFNDRTRVKFVDKKHEVEYEIWRNESKDEEKYEVFVGYGKDVDYFVIDEQSWSKLVDSILKMQNHDLVFGVFSKNM